MIGPEPIEVIHFQGRGFDCSECGAFDLAEDEIEHERIVFDDGTAANRFLCLPCAVKLDSRTHEGEANQ